MRHDWARAKEATLKILGSVNSITMPLGFGLAAVSEQATVVLLGQQWHAATPFVAGFAIIGVVQYLTTPLSTLLNVEGHVRVQTRIVWTEFLAFISMAFLLTPTYHLQGLMIARIGSGLLQSFLMIIAARTYAGISLGSTAGSLLRPFTGSLFMYGILATWGNLFLNPLANLVVNIVLGAIVYTSWLLLTWLLAKQPDGLEATVIQFVRSKTRRLSSTKH
jgi:O-antigen/teichoic acid export membrane protein